MLFLSGNIRTSVQCDQSEHVIRAITVATNDAIVYRVEDYIAEGAFQSKCQTCVAAIVF